MKNKIKKLLCAFLASVMLVSGAAVYSGAETEFKVTGSVLTTDIKAYINGVEIPGYNVDGRMVILASDLRGYGFDVNYDDETRTASVTLPSTEFEITPAVSKASDGSIGVKVMDVYSTDIKVLINGARVTAYNVDNRMAFAFNELKEFGSYNYDNDKRASSLNITTTGAMHSERDGDYYNETLSLTKSEIKISVGKTAALNANLTTNDDKPGTFKWYISDKTVVEASRNNSGGINIKGISVGSATITCKYNDLVQTCEITVSEKSDVVGLNGFTPSYLSNGLFIYGDGVFTPAFYSQASAEKYARAALAYKNLFGNNTRVSVVVAPVSSIVIDDPNVKASTGDHETILNQMAALMDKSINFVDTYSSFYDHRDEYLFFKSDHHWTQRGAYYAYTAFAESVGFTPTALSDFTYGIRNDSYKGSFYSWTGDYRVAGFTDYIEAFYPTKAHTMTISSSTGATYTQNTTIVNTNNTYVTFIGGDNPYTVINVPENDQSLSCIVLKDSFGNAFVPFLCEHYGNIYVVDVRYSTFNIYERFKDYGIDDIIFVNNIQAANSTSWGSDYLTAIGQW